MKAYHYILATVLGMLAMSCTKDIDEPVVPEQPGDYLVISLRSDDEPQSKAAAADTLSVVPFEGETPVELEGMELVGTAEDWPCEDMEEVATKGKIVTGHSDMHGNSIRGYFDQYDATAGYRKYAYNESFSWISSGSNQCRSANRFLFGKGQKYRFTFVWPETVTLNDNLQATYSVGTDVKNQKELLYSTQEVNVTSELSTLTVPFSHALSRVNLKTTSTCPSLTINSIKLSDVYYRGTFSALTGDITPGTSYKTTFTLAENLSVTGEADLCSGARSFLVMPQTVPSTGRLEVVFTYDGKQHTVTANLSGNRWEKGKIITYTLNFNKINGWIKQITIPDELTVNVNETKSITASVTPSTATLKRVTWSQTDASKASLASAGDLVTNVTGTAVGNTSVKATAADEGGVESNSCIVHVINQIKTLTVAPSTATVQNGQTQQYTATVTYWSGTTKSVTSGSSWSSSSTSVGTVSSGGLATASATNTGQTTITASYTEDGVTLTGTAVFKVVAPTVSSVSLGSDHRNILVGQSINLGEETLTVTYSNGTTETISVGGSDVTVVRKTTGDSSVNTTLNGKTVTGTARGIDTYTISYGGKSCDIAVNVSEIVITPASANININASQTFTAKIRNYNNTTLSASFTWSSSNTGVATVTSSGVATGAASGTAHIIAAYNGTYGIGSAYAVLNVENGVISTETETQNDSETRNTTLSDRSEDTGYSAWVKINNKTSETVSPAATTVSVTYGGSHTHTVYGRVQPQKRDGTRSREVRHMADGTTQYGDWTEWTWGDWYNNGNVVETQKSSQTVNDSLSAPSGFTTWFTSAGAVSANEGSSRTATLTVSNGDASGSATLTQQADSMDHYEYQNLDVTISANPTTISADGGSSTLTYSATYQRRTIYKSGKVGSWSNMSATPTVTGSATGFSRNGTAVTVSANPNTTQRSVTYTASYTISGTSLSDSDSVTITQEGKVVVTEIELKNQTSYNLLDNQSQSVNLSDEVVTVYYSNGTEDEITVGTSGVTLARKTSGDAQANTSVSGKTITAITRGTDTYILSYQGASYEFPVYVNTLVVSPASAEIFVGETQTFSATIIKYDGTSTTARSTWTSSSIAVATASGTSSSVTASGLSAGTTTIKASYNNVNGIGYATAELTVKRQDVITYDLVISGDPVTTKVGKDINITNFTATRYTVVNGVRQSGSGVDVTSSTTLHSKNTGIATVTGIKVHGVAVGTTKLYGTCTYSGSTLSSESPSTGSATYINVTVKANSGWGVDDDDDPGSGEGEGGDYNHNN